MNKSEYDDAVKRACQLQGYMEPLEEKEQTGTLSLDEKERLKRYSEEMNRLTEPPSKIFNGFLNTIKPFFIPSQTFSLFTSNRKSHSPSPQPPWKGNNTILPKQVGRITHGLCVLFSFTPDEGVLGQPAILP